MHQASPSGKAPRTLSPILLSWSKSHTLPTNTLYQSLVAITIAFRQAGVIENNTHIVVSLKQHIISRRFRLHISLGLPSVYSNLQLCSTVKNFLRSDSICD